VTDRIVSLTSGVFFAAGADEDLLSAAQRAHWLVRYGCRNGNCEACAATLLQGRATQAGTAIDATDNPQKILLCLCRADSDLQIELPGNPQHGSSEQARRYYARLNSSTTDGADSNTNANGRIETQLHITLPAGRRVPIYAGQYVLLEHGADLLRAEIDTLSSNGRELYLRCASALTLRNDSYVTLLCPLGYCYNATARTSILILHDDEQYLQATLLKQALPEAVLFNDEKFNAQANVSLCEESATPKVFDTVLACTRDPRLAAYWYQQLLNRQMAFDEFRSDTAIDYRWRVCRQDDNGNSFAVSTGLSESAARNQAAEFEQRGHKQLYWAEPMAVPSSTPATCTRLRFCWSQS